MSRPAVKAPWTLARSAQAAVAVVALVDVCRVVALRAHDLHPQDASSQAAYGLASWLYVNLMTVTAVLFLVWFSRCRRNAQLLSPTPLPGSAAWAVLAWLIPVFNLWVPRGLILDVHGASGPDGSEKRDRVLVNVWWAAWAGHTAVVAVGGQLGQEPSLPFLLTVEALDLAAGALAIAVIQRVTARQATALSRVLSTPDAVSLPHPS